MSATPPPRRNGMHAPFDALQVVSWAVFGGLFVLFYGCELPHAPESLAPWVGWAYGGAAALVMALCLVSALADPTDGGVLAERRRRAGAAGAGATGAWQPAADAPYCETCCAHVGQRTKHCRICRKCVADFDHHCKWLNTCVGGVNYRPFFALLIAACSLTAGQAAVGVAMLLEQSRGVQPSEPRYAAFCGGSGLAAVVVLATVLASTAALAVGQLLGFHTMLRWRGLSTWDWILARRRKKAEQEQRELSLTAP